MEYPLLGNSKTNRLHLAIDGSGAVTIDTVDTGEELCYGSNVKWKLTDDGIIDIVLTGISERSVNPDRILRDRGYWARHGESRWIGRGYGTTTNVVVSIDVEWYLYHGPTTDHYVRSRFIELARDRSRIFIPEE